MSPLPPPPIQAWGAMPAVWRCWFRDIFAKTGGSTGRVIVIDDDDDSGGTAIDELEARLAVSISPRPDVSGLEARIADLEAQIAGLAASRLGELSGRIDDLAVAQERPRGWASDVVTFTPAWTALTEVGGVTKTGSFLTVGDLILLTATIESAGGTSAATAGATYLALPVPARLAGVATIADVTALTGLAAGVVTTTRIYVPSWAATADTIAINATYRRA